MKTRKPLLFVIIAEFLIILVLAYNVFAAYQERQNIKELFINQSYFLLEDASANIESENYDDAILNFVELEAIFTMFRRETNGDFYYNDPGFWGVSADMIRGKDYTPRDLASIENEIQEAITSLSDDTGIAENPELSYRELNDIFNPIYGCLE